MTFTIRASKGGETIETDQIGPTATVAKARGLQDRLDGLNHRRWRLRLRAVRVRPTAFVRSPKKSERNLTCRRCGYAGKCFGRSSRAGIITEIVSPPSSSPRTTSKI